MKYLNLFYKMQLVNHAMNWKNFILVPLNSYGFRHIRYDRRSFLFMLKRVKLCPVVKKVNAKTGFEKNYQINNGNDLNWENYFKYPDKKNHGASFKEEPRSIVYDKWS